MKYLNLEGLAHFVSIIKSKLAVSVDSNAAAIAAVEAKIPAQASAENQLADKNFVNSSIATNTAYFIGTFDSVDELNAYDGTKTNNDYAFVRSTNAEGGTAFSRYKWDGTAWKFEYELNNSSFTAAQWAAVNSGITAGMLPAGVSDTNRLSLLKHPFVGFYASTKDLPKTGIEVGSMAVVMTSLSESFPSGTWYIAYAPIPTAIAWRELNSEISGVQGWVATAREYDKTPNTFGFVALSNKPNADNPPTSGVAATPYAVKMAFQQAITAQTAATEAKNQMLGAALNASNPITDTNPPRLAAGKIQAHTVYGADAGGPATYGNLVNIGGSGGAQVFLEWSSGQSAAGQAVSQGIWYRSMRDNQSAWTAWTKMAASEYEGLAAPMTLVAGDIPYIQQNKTSKTQYADSTIEYNGFTMRNMGFVSYGSSIYNAAIVVDFVKDPKTESGGIQFKVSGKARIVIYAGAVSMPRTIEMLNDKGYSLWQTSVSRYGYYTFDYGGNPTGGGDTMCLCSQGENVRILAVYVNSF